jgi:sulfite reductase (NADPH) hemoprotein beta-component
MNSCGHHHIGHIGILGVDKHGREYYQVSIGGDQGPEASLGKVIGPAFGIEEIGGVVERRIECYLARRDDDAERFIDTVRRIGLEPFKEHVYGNAHSARSHRARDLATA